MQNETHSGSYEETINKFIIDHIVAILHGHIIYSITGVQKHPT